ncbi:cation:proton antiporter [Sphingomonas morindae]|uniref:Sodium:proton antiporter n=1 Tax=Sphingomonas morindae TaxID=1541170 RepID=A0ABY4X799_9SPHN|nr:sodium:proton antiporter [Sphingomonas morindae]USI72782.1 sodium:proton antiporter [Sphingomonas morindae]
MEDTILLLVVGVAVAGVFGQWLGWRLKLPAIIPLLVIGAIAGPIAGIVKPSDALGEVMRPAIGMAVAIIVFEGGLNLNLRELRSAGSGVLRLVAVALPLNWLFGTLAAHYVAGLSWPVAILVGAILVVTGPTVIMPLLRQARLEPRSAAFLKWEAIVNDPIGATITLLVLSFLTLSTTMSSGDAALQLAWRTLLGGGIAAALGLAVPIGIRTLFRRDLAPEYLKTPILLAGALGVYAAGEAIQPETGLVGATLFGVVLANIDVTGLQELRRFKESLTVFLVSGLFILLTANIDRETVMMLSWPIAATTAAILFIARPLAIGLATLGARVSWAERLLVGWIGPRGVVAAAIAGVAGERLAKAGYPDARLVLPLVFAVIASTVLLHGLSLAPLARRLKLASGGRGGLLIVGASAWTIGLGEALQGSGIPVLMVDRSANALRAARLAGLPTLRVEVLSLVGEEVIDLREFEHLLAATPDDAYNALVCTRFAPELGRERVYQIAPDESTGRHAAAREWRGKIAIGFDMVHQRLSDLMQGGAAFLVERADQRAVSEEPSWPIASISAGGEFAIVSPEQDMALPSEGAIIVLHQPVLASAAPRSRRGLARLRWPRLKARA